MSEDFDSGRGDLEDKLLLLAELLSFSLSLDSDLEDEDASCFEEFECEDLMVGLVNLDNNFLFVDPGFRPTLSLTFFAANFAFSLMDEMLGFLASGFFGGRPGPRLTVLEDLVGEARSLLRSFSLSWSPSLSIDSLSFFLLGTSPLLALDLKAGGGNVILFLYYY